MLLSREHKHFFVWLAIAYAALMVAWTVLATPYSALFRAGGNTVFARFGSDGRVRFLNPNALSAADLRGGVAPPGAVGERDTALELSSIRTPESFGYLRTSARYIGYVPTAVFLALLLAKPMAWSRKGWSLLWGMLLIHGFILFRLAILICDGFTGTKAYALFHPSPFWMRVLDFARDVLADAPTVSYVAPTFIWFLVTFRQTEWSVFRGTAADSAGTT